MDQLHPYQQAFQQNYQQQYSNLYPVYNEESRPMAFFDIMIGPEYAGRIIFELFREVVPNTVDNFLYLCKNYDKFRTYRGVPFHKIVKDVGVYGGDVTQGNGRGGWTKEEKNLPAENFRAKHKIEGLLSLCRVGNNEYNSQFMITTFPLPWLDNKHVVFGRVIKGYDVVKKMEMCGDSLGKPTKQVMIAECGQYAGGKISMLPPLEGKRELFNKNQFGY